VERSRPADRATVRVTSTALQNDQQPDHGDALSGDAASASSTVPFREALRFWTLLGFISFGGPAGQIATMHRELVERRRWISEEAYLRALNFCAMLPGPEAQQLATYVGWRLHGIRGGLVAGSFFVIPGIFVLLALSWLSVAHGDVTLIKGVFYGIQVVVIAIVAEAVLRIGRRALKHRALYAFTAAAFVALAVFSIPFPLVIAAAGLTGLVLAQRWPQVFRGGHVGASAGAARPADERTAARYPPMTRALKFLAIFGLLWAVPVGALVLWEGSDGVVAQEAFFFTRAAFVTFGGAYAVLSYITNQAVNNYGWLSAEEMVLGLGLAESTPGPLIMVTQHVGFIGAWNLHGDNPQLPYAILGALVTTYVTFLPCFLLIFVGAPYIEALAGNLRLQAALIAITAAVVGVILNLAVFFGRHVLFPDGGIDWFAAVVAVGMFVLAVRYHLPIHLLVLIGGALGIVWALAV
jgi:chromate transporter